MSAFFVPTYMVYGKRPFVTYEHYLHIHQPYVMHFTAIPPPFFSSYFLHAYLSIIFEGAIIVYRIIADVFNSGLCDILHVFQPPFFVRRQTPTIGIQLYDIIIATFHLSLWQGSQWTVHQYSNVCCEQTHEALGQNIYGSGFFFLQCLYLSTNVAQLCSIIMYLFAFIC